MKATTTTTTTSAEAALIEALEALERAYVEYAYLAAESRDIYGTERAVTRAKEAARRAHRLRNFSMLA